jgi:phosphoribosylformylglycinamidine synthase
VKCFGTSRTGVRRSERAKIFSPRPVGLATMRTNLFAGENPFRMKAKIIITPKKAVLDPQGKTVQTALEHMGYTGVTGVHIGKYIEIDLAPGTDKAAAHKALNEAAHKLLSNPVIEDYKLEIE